MPEYIDSHCHITCDRLFPRIDEIMENCKKNNVSQLLVVCCERQEALRALQLKQKYPMIRIAYGFYPCDTYDLGEDDYADLENFCREGLLDVIGEIGLDYHYDDTDKESRRRPSSGSFSLQTGTVFPSASICAMPHWMQ